MIIVKAFLAKGFGHSIRPFSALQHKICADRWMKNKYGGPLREMVAKSYTLACYVDMVDTPAFSSDVIAYPAITIIRREKPGSTRVAQRPNIDTSTLT